LLGRDRGLVLGGSLMKILLLLLLAECGSAVYHDDNGNAVPCVRDDAGVVCYCSHVYGGLAISCVVLK
jgi:hypothetical protein